MTSSAALLHPKSPSPPAVSDSAAAFSSFNLTEPVCCVVQLKHQSEGVVHQVTLDPAKIQGELIRIGDWPGDEARGWQHMGNVKVLAVLGRSVRYKDEQGRDTMTVKPFIEREAAPADPVDG